MDIFDLQALPEWHLQAACRGMDPSLFFPGLGESTRKAKAICASCPVRSECLDWGMNEQHGIWGGMVLRARRDERRRRVA